MIKIIEYLIFLMILHLYNHRLTGENAKIYEFC